MGFLNGIDGVILNSRFAYGQYTNTHTKGKKGGRSIVDFAVVKKQDLFRVSCLLVHKLYFLGKSGSSMAHDSIIETNVVAPVNNSSCSPAEPRPVYGRITGANETGFDTALKSVLPSFDNFHVLSATDKFELLIKAFSFAKKNVLQIDLNPSPSPSLPKSLRKIYACIKRIRSKMVSSSDDFVKLKSLLDKKISDFFRVLKAFRKSCDEKVIAKLENFDVTHSNKQF